MGLNYQVFPLFNPYSPILDDIQANSNGVFHYNLYLNNFKEESKKPRLKRYQSNILEDDIKEQEVLKLLSKHIEFEFPTFNIYYIINSQNRVIKHPKSELFDTLVAAYSGNAQGTSTQRAGESNIGFNSAGFTSFANFSSNASKKSMIFNPSVTNSFKASNGYSNNSPIVDLLLAKSEAYVKPKSFLYQCPLLGYHSAKRGDKKKKEVSGSDSSQIMPTLKADLSNNFQSQSVPLKTENPSRTKAHGQRLSLKTIVGLKTMASYMKNSLNITSINKNEIIIREMSGGFSEEMSEKMITESFVAESIKE